MEKCIELISKGSVKVKRVKKKKNCSKMSEGISCVKPIDKKGLGTSEKLRIIKLKPKV